MMLAFALALLATASTPTDPTYARIKALMQQPLPPAPAGALRSTLDDLKGRVTANEASSILDTLAGMEPDALLATLSALEATPWKEKKNLSMLDKLIRRGVADRSTFIAELVDLLNDKLDLGYPPRSKVYEQRLAKLDHGSARHRDHKATRQANRDLVKVSKGLLYYLEKKESLGYKRAADTLRKTARMSAIVITSPLWWPILLIGPLDISM